MEAAQPIDDQLNNLIARTRSTVDWLLNCSPPAVAGSPAISYSRWVGTTSWSLPLHAMHSLKIHSFQFQDPCHQFSLILRLCVQRRALNSFPPHSFPLNSSPSKVFTFYLQGNYGSFWKRIWDFWCINVHLIRWLYDYAIVLTSTIQFFICCAILAQLLHSH